MGFACSVSTTNHCGIRDMRDYWKDITKDRIRSKLKKALTRPCSFQELHTCILVNDTCMIAKRRQKFRIKGQIDWVKYLVADLAHALDTDTVKEYYEKQLAKYPANWGNKEFEMSMKTKYASSVSYLTKCKDCRED